MLHNFLEVSRRAGTTGVSASIHFAASTAAVALVTLVPDENASMLCSVGYNLYGTKRLYPTERSIEAFPS